ncbi:hypothetical protein RJT34_28845 [Clitoria ternatea]|uniref:B box-type domain-containing protein n=1 Tax=Clitoria ternatea TaxID=43366 RepID=A0AAN9FDT2_CLITE
MKNCELCKVPARTFCESDQASLCWDCDAKVHGANFLVARHTRTLLCHACQSLTPWKASGAALGNTVSLCERCAGGTREHAEEESQGGNDDDIDSDNDDEGEDDESGDEVSGDEDGDNQVVPWSSTAPPPAPSSSSSEESVSKCNNVDEDMSQTTLKRRRKDSDFQDSNAWGYQRSFGEKWRGEIDWLGCDGGPPSKVSMRRLSDGETRPASPYGCYDGGESEDV